MAKLGEGLCELCVELCVVEMCVEMCAEMCAGVCLELDERRENSNAYDHGLHEHSSLSEHFPAEGGMVLMLVV